jgi:transcriptional regulator with XRE-family HTH domain
MEKYMLPLDCVSRIKWDGVAGENLRKARGKTSRRELAELLNTQLKNPTPPLAASYVQKLESNILETVPVEILQAVSVCLDVSIGEIIDVYRYM